MKLREEASGLALWEIWPSLEEFVHFKCLALLMKGWGKWVTTLCGVGGSKIIVKQNLNIQSLRCTSGCLSSSSGSVSGSA